MKRFSKARKRERPAEIKVGSVIAKIYRSVTGGDNCSRGLEANQAKKLCLPNFSAHPYSVTIPTELTALGQVDAESARLDRIVQDALDREMQEFEVER